MTKTPLTDTELRARTEFLLKEAINVADQLKIQTDRLSKAIAAFHSEAKSVQTDLRNQASASGKRAGNQGGE